MAEQILNATAPRDVWPLLHEGKLVGLDKLSGHGQSIEDLVAAVQRAYEAPGKAEMGEPGQRDESRARMRKGFMPMQTGVGVPGGQSIRVRGGDDAIRPRQAQARRWHYEYVQ